MSTARAARRSQGTPLVLVLWGLGYLAIGLAIAAAIAWPIYESFRVVVIASVGYALAIAIVLISRRLRLRWWGVILVSVFVYVLAVVPLAIPSAVGSIAQLLGGVRDGLTGITLGWKQLLTLELPLGAYQGVLVPFFVTVFVGSLIAASAIVRGTRSAALAVPAVVLMSAFGVVFGSSNTSDSVTFGSLSVPAAREVLLGIALIVVSLVWLIGRARITRARALNAARAQTGTVRQRRENVSIAVRRNVLAGVIVLVALAAGVLVTPTTAALETRQALRNGIDPLLIVAKQPSPLSGYRTWFDADHFDAELFTVVGATEQIDRIRLATLDYYDGETFHVTGATGADASVFRRLPRTEPTSGNPVQLTITIGDGYSGIWVPVPDGLAAAPVFAGSRAGELSDAFYVSSSSDSAIDVARDAAGENGLEPADSYTVYAAPTSSDLSALGSDSPGKSLLGDEPFPALEDWVKLQEVPRTAEGLLDLIDSLRTRGYLSHSVAEGIASAKWVSALEGRASFVLQPSYSGHSQSRIASLFTTLLVQQRVAGEEANNEALVSAVGDDEQFATAAALLARYFGFESRVVVGVRLQSDDSELGVAPCDDVCTGENVSAWIEVSRQGRDWVAIDATPQFIDAPITIAAGFELPQNPTIPDEAQADVVDPPEVDRGNSDLLSEQPVSDESWITPFLPAIRVAGFSSLSLFLLVLPLLVIVFAKGSRRRLRRSMRVPEVSIVSAWDELVDSYVDYGVPLPRAASRLDFARRTRRPAAIALAAIVDRAVFAEHPPGRDASSASWELLDQERVDLAASSTVGERLKARLNPASFLRQFGPETRVGTVLSLLGRKEIAR